VKLAGWHAFSLLFFFLRHGAEEDYLGTGWQQLLLTLVEELEMFGRIVDGLLGLILSE
jgi:hypothetical protein